jgi:hypothetical protein
MLFSGLQVASATPTVWLKVTDKNAQIIARWSVAVAIFGAVCNVLCWSLTNNKHFYLRHERFVCGPSSFFFECMLLAPLLVLVVLRRCAPVMLFYACALLWILKAHVDELIYFSKFGKFAAFEKGDSPAICLLLLGLLSIAVIVVWAAIHLVRRALASDRSTS